KDATRARTDTRSARPRWFSASRALPRSPARPPPSTRSRPRAPSRPCRFRSGSTLNASRRSCRVTGTERVGLYTLVRVERNGLEPGIPGQFFMLEAPSRLLPRPFSLCLAPPGELAFLVDVIGPGTEAIAGLQPGDEIAVFG